MGATADPAAGSTRLTAVFVDQTRRPSDSDAHGGLSRRLPARVATYRAYLLNGKLTSCISCSVAPVYA